LQKPIDIIQFVVEIDTQLLHKQNEVNSLLVPFGLDFHKPPDQTFRKLAHHFSGASITRFVTSILMTRVFCCEITVAHIGIILRDTTVARKQAVNDAWDSLKEACENNSRVAADLVLAYVDIYVNQDPTSPQSPLDPKIVFPLVWQLLVFGISQTLTAAQKAHAQEALRQVGARAGIPLAARLAENFFQPNAALFLEAQLMYHAWYAAGNFDDEP
jgi:hypothetical protein